MKDLKNNESRKLWNGAAYGTPYQRTHTRLIERLSTASLAAVSVACERSVKQLLEDAGVRA